MRCMNNNIDYLIHYYFDVKFNVNIVNNTTLKTWSINVAKNQHSTFPTKEFKIVWITVQGKMNTTHVKI